jgi:lipopolysaccharide/colanic/teichoic acid biosynthesis glycosyltransferase
MSCPPEQDATVNREPAESPDFDRGAIALDAAKSIRLDAMDWPARSEKLGNWAIVDWLLDTLNRRRVQLSGAFFLGIFLPAFVRWRLDVLGMAPKNDFVLLTMVSFHNAVIGTVLAQISGYVAMRQMKAHPGVRSMGYVLYSFAMTYGALGLAFLFVRADYSRYQILSSFILTVMWFIFVDYMTAKRAIWRLAFLPGLAAAALPRAPRVFWYGLSSPELSAPNLTGVVADLRAAHTPEWERFLARCALNGLPVFDIRQVSEWLTGRVKVQHLSENTLSASLWRTIYARAKRLVDIAGVIFVGPLFLLGILVTGVLIRLESPGPALFTQMRMGHRGRTFTIYKLRSMRADAVGQDFTSDNDPRITRIGAFIRKYRIDELPQIWNILRGEMSWIGPRPEAQPLAEWYENEVPFYSYRHMVRPGITGWAQVNQGNVADVDAALEKLHYDFYYIKNLSPWLDLLIMAKTMQTIRTGFGAR